MFIPLLFMGGVVGRLFREFAITLSPSPSDLGVGVADADADDVRALAAPRADPTAGAAGCIAGASAASTACSLLRRRRWTGCCAISGLTLVVTLLTLIATGCLYVVDPEGILPAAGHRLSDRRHRGARRTSPLRRWRNASSRSRRSSRSDPDVVAVDSLVGAGGVNATLNSGRMYIDI